MKQTEVNRAILFILTIVTGAFATLEARQRWTNRSSSVDHALI